MVYLINIDGFRRTHADKDDECKNKRHMGSAFVPNCYYRVFYLFTFFSLFYF